jgi:uncharacterized protein (DUF1778 family)
MARSDEMINLRVPPGMRDRIHSWAKHNKRSMNSEVVATLDEKYPAPPEPESLNERLADAAMAVAGEWTVALKALGQEPRSNVKLKKLMDALSEAGKL